MVTCTTEGGWGQGQQGGGREEDQVVRWMGGVIKGVCKHQMEEEGEWETLGVVVQKVETVKGDQKGTSATITTKRLKQECGRPGLLRGRISRPAKVTELLKFCEGKSGRVCATGWRQEKLP
ncbi:hypothetical protein E2C01_058873 [Portunus trituberculatus]|uniref:Uncharacterized protein n=1 Tax=Portunus trituberculatus TaxID=210409 RepID=A0A5B7H3X2_PORTR|nr:hypothetical protein [Portunus trituberculatus]